MLTFILNVDIIVGIEQNSPERKPGSSHPNDGVEKTLLLLLFFYCYVYEVLSVSYHFELSIHENSYQFMSILIDSYRQQELSLENSRKSVRIVGLNSCEFTIKKIQFSYQS